tara:strand:+ start:2690 stop:2983 length:294 start_codon:yes stop_codon:yes gene_type:complete
MAAIVVNKSNNVVLYFTLAADFSNDYLVFTDVTNITTHVPDTTPETHKIIDNVTLPKKWFANCFKYENGEYTILTDVVDAINEVFEADNQPLVEVEI